MPLFYKHNIDNNTSLAVWHIREPEDFFYKTHLSPREISNPQKKLRHLAGRFLLKILNQEFPINEILLDGRRPYLPGNSCFFSISHCGDYAAAILSKERPVGIDVELVTTRIGEIETKFLNERERKIISESQSELTQNKKLTSCWSAKESIFKWYAGGEVSFKEDIDISSLSWQNEEGIIRAIFSKEMNRSLKIPFRFFDELCLTWVY